MLAAFTTCTPPAGLLGFRRVARHISIYCSVDKCATGPSDGTSSFYSRKLFNSTAALHARHAAACGADIMEHIILEPTTLVRPSWPVGALLPSYRSLSHHPASITPTHRRSPSFASRVAAASGGGRMPTFLLPGHPHLHRTFFRQILILLEPFRLPSSIGYWGS